MSFKKLYIKYAVSQIRPPKPQKEITVNVPKYHKEIEDRWKLLQDSEGLDSLTEKPAENIDALLEQAHDSYKSEPTTEYEKGYLAIVDNPYKENKGAPDTATVPPAGNKKASFPPDTILKMCTGYYNLCCEAHAHKRKVS